MDEMTAMYSWLARYLGLLMVLTMVDLMVLLKVGPMDSLKGDVKESLMVDLKVVERDGQTVSKMVDQMV